MRITPKRVKNLSFLVVDNFFTDQELQEVVQEARYLKTFLLGPEKTNTAKDENNRLKKIGQGVFLDTFYEGKRENSKILKANRILFSKKICSVAEELDSVFTFIRYSNVDYTILNSYVEDGEYKAHHDTSRISAVTFLREGDFTGGEFQFPQQNVKIPAEQNRTVIFPSCALHQALPLKGTGNRISIAQFINYED
tara:strand:- start:417 stop:1001 length:585 start_codon:yes stop_codon:yes gene_type:complete